MPQHRVAALVASGRGRAGGFSLVLSTSTFWAGGKDPSLHSPLQKPQVDTEQLKCGQCDREMEFLALF